MDEAEQSMNSNSGVLGPVTTPIVYDPLVVGTPVVTGDPFVGYTLTCSEPSIEGGSGSTQVNYYWQDSNNQRVLYMGSTQVVSEVDIGRSVQCQVAVFDTVTGDSVTVTSNAVGPINRPVLPEFDAYVNSELHDDPSADVGVGISGQVVLEVRQQAVSNPALDITYTWSIRTGTGRLSGDTSATGIIYIAPDSAPGGAVVQCKVESRDAFNNAFAADVTILVAE